MTIISQHPDMELQMLQDQQLSHFQLQQSLSQHSPLQQSSSPATSNVDVPSPAYNEFQLSSIPQSPVPFDQQDIYSRRKSIPRSAGLSHGTLQSRQSFPMAPQPAILPSQTMPQQRTLSHQAFPIHPMHRTSSNLSTQSASPFVTNGPITPPPKSELFGQHHRNSHAMDYLNREEPLNPYSAGQFMMHRSHSTRTRARPAMANLSTVSESRLMDPSTYFATLEGYNDQSGSSTYLSSSMPAGPMHFTNTDMPVWTMSNASICGSMTTGMTPDTAPMTRENSSLYESHSVGGGMHMMQLGSHQGTDLSLDSPRYAPAGSGQNSPLSKGASPSEDDLNGVGSSLTHNFLTPYGHVTNAADDGPASSQAMSRSASNASAASNKSSSSSLGFRAKETLRRQNRNVAPLKPKPSSSAAGQRAADGQCGRKDGKTAISKTKYVRPRQPKVFCDKCKDHPEGFRGEHELRRHRDAKHPEHGMVKKWICVDPSSRNLPVGVAVVNPLDKCKACKAMKKYGAYYNAAAHLRRTHFKEKPSRAKKSNGNVRSEDDKRGGKGGGDWPAMTELKNWMKEVWVNKDEVKVDSDEENEEDNSVDASTAEMDIDLDQDMGQMPVEYPIVQHATGNMVSDMNFTNMYPTQLAMNNMMPLYSSQHLISSANFTDYSCSPMTPTYSYMPSGIPPYGSVVSSNDTVTPAMANYNDTMGNVGDLQFDEMTYPH